MRRRSSIISQYKEHTKALKISKIASINLSHKNYSYIYINTVCLKTKNVYLTYFHVDCTIYNVHVGYAQMMFKVSLHGQAWWLTHAIPATQEVGIRVISV
jgi:hypothetical protein